MSPPFVPEVRPDVLRTERVQVASCFLGTERTQTATKFWGPSVFKLASCILGTESTQIAPKLWGPHFQNTVEVKTHPCEGFGGFGRSLSYVSSPRARRVTS